VVVAEFETVNFQAGVVVPMPTVVVPIKPEPAAEEWIVRIGVPSSWAVYELIVPVAFVATGISAKVWMPASVSNASEPALKFAIVVMPEVKSYSTASESTVNPPLIEVVANELLVEILNMASAVVEVAMVQAYEVESGMVEVDEEA